MPRGSVYNEFIHEEIRSFTAMNEVEQLVLYETLEFWPVPSTLRVDIWHPEHEWLGSFGITRENRIELSETSLSAAPLRGGLYSGNRLYLVWLGAAPQEHFLTVSYSWNEKHKPVKKINWLMEGF